MDLLLKPMAVVRLCLWRVCLCTPVIIGLGAGLSPPQSE